MKPQRDPLMLLVRSSTGITEPIGTLHANFEPHKDEPRYVVKLAYKWQNPGHPLSGIWKYTSYCVKMDDYEPNRQIVDVPDGPVITLNARTIRSIDYKPLQTRIQKALEKESRWEDWHKGLSVADKALFKTLTQTVSSMVDLIREEIAFSQRPS